MDILKDYLDSIKIPGQKARMEKLFSWINENFPGLEAVIKWNQPMFIDHGTFIIGFSMARHHMAFSPEEAGIIVFSKEIKEAGYEHTKGLAKIKWVDEIDYSLLKRIIEFNIADKKEGQTFFRK